MSVTERTAIEALVEHGSQNLAADALGWKRTKLQSRLRAVQGRAARAATPEPEAPPPVHGHVSVQPNQVPATIPGATAARYILTAAQNNTPAHPAFLANLKAYAAAIGATIMVSRFSYNKSSYGAKATKAGRAPGVSDTAGLWYDPAILPYVCDDPERHGSCRWQLAPATGADGGLVWCAEMNILPTAVLPLSGLESYTGAASGVFPHSKIALESVPVIGDRPPKMNYTTGAVTQRNYIAKKEGLKGEFHHQFGALLVEVDLVTGDWWARQLNATDDGAFYDLTFRVADGAVTRGHRIKAINWGDIHASEIDPTVRMVNWGASHGRAALDVLRPEVQLWHDTFSMRSRGHHELKSFGSRYAKHVAGIDHDSVEREVKLTADLLQLAHRDWCTTVVVSSNHDRHLDRWLEETDYKTDPVNAEFFLEAQLARVKAIREGRDWDGLKWAITWSRGALGDFEFPAVFLGRDESFTICGPDHPVECGSHGDEGPNGARGNAANLSKLGVRMNVGHAHSAALRHGLAQAGVCNRRLPYAHGPSSWSISHIATYANGKRAMLTQRGTPARLWL
ncbi:MAG: hypothetical protein V4593_08125 [Pseudomonadota bacterium]